MFPSTQIFLSNAVREAKKKRFILIRTVYELLIPAWLTMPRT